MALIRSAEMVAAQVSAIFNDGFSIGREARAFIESTYGLSLDKKAAPPLRELIDTVDDPDLLLDLIIYPDETIQERLEPVLQTIEEALPEEEAIMEIISRITVHAGLTIPFTKETLRIQVPYQVLHRFLKRLHLKRLSHPLLKGPLLAIHSLKNPHKIRVKLRNSRFEITENKALALSRFFEHFPEEAPIFFHAIDFLMEWFTEYHDSPDIETALSIKKQTLIHHLHRAADLTDHMSKMNMETFLLSGNRMIQIDEARTRRMVSLIRSIRCHVYKIVDLNFEDDTDEGNPATIDLEKKDCFSKPGDKTLP